MTSIQETALLEQCAAIDSSTWSDALDQLHIDGLIEGLPQRSGQGRMCGFAITARQVPGQLHDFDKADFAVNVLVESVGPVNVLVIDVGGQAISTLGGLASFGVTQRKARGVLIDGGCRDVDEIRATGLWLASRHVTPRTGKGRLRTQQYGESVTIGGVQVAQGDLIIGDDTGIVAVPRARLQEALDIAQRILAVDKDVEARIKGGETFDSAVKATGYLPQKKATP
ncbi:RraA family protein [Diaphorobacter ruginosibacter]|uniref:RraA family protein n=1 Tax=Diaphorobacter ruginosibacter TaxID=1715720 RepID=UPI00333FACFF